MILFWSQIKQVFNFSHLNDTVTIFINRWGQTYTTYLKVNSVGLTPSLTLLKTGFMNQIKYLLVEQPVFVLLKRERMDIT